jgi:hypothetical protein
VNNIRLTNIYSSFDLCNLLCVAKSRHHKMDGAKNYCTMSLAKLIPLLDYAY